MKYLRTMTLIITHTLFLGVGVAAGIYLLPILIAPDAPSISAIENSQQTQRFQGEFDRQRKDSDQLHWGEGEFSINEDTISFAGELAPGPDYTLYLSPLFIEEEVEFSKYKDQMALVGDVDTFNNFIIPISPGIDPSEYNTVIVWCDAFDEFITSGEYHAVVSK